MFTTVIVLSLLSLLVSTEAEPTGSHEVSEPRQKPLRPVAKLKTSAPASLAKQDRAAA